MNLITKEVRLQAEARDFIKLEDWCFPYAATLTLKQARKEPGSAGRTIRTPLTKELASRNFRHFTNLLNREIFGKAAIRFGKKTRMFPVLEGGLRIHLHYHAIIDCPREELLREFPRIVEGCWRKTDWGNKQVRVSANADEGWLIYITKLRTKEDFASSIDWMNVAN